MNGILSMCRCGEKCIQQFSPRIWQKEATLQILDIYLRILKFIIINTVRGYKLGMSGPGMVQWPCNDNMLLKHSKVTNLIHFHFHNHFILF
jgi:hypothetical protein